MSIYAFLSEGVLRAILAKFLNSDGGVYLALKFPSFSFKELPNFWTVLCSKVKLTLNVGLATGRASEVIHQYGSG